VQKLFLWSPLTLIAAWTGSSLYGIWAGRPALAAVTALNVVLLSYAIGHFIGWPALRQDLRAGSHRSLGIAVGAAAGSPPTVIDLTTNGPTDGGPQPAPLDEPGPGVHVLN
jgi:hypothetical protein